MAESAEEVSPEAAKLALAAVEKVMELPPAQRRDYLEMLGHASTKFMRMLNGTEYTRGWLEAALAELDQPPLFTLRKPQ